MSNPIEMLDFLPMSTKDAFLRMAGNFDKSLSANMLRSWAHNLSALKPPDIESAIERCVNDGRLEHFPRWHEFAARLPQARSVRTLDPQKFFSPAPLGDGPWVGNVECLNPKQREDIAIGILKATKGHLSRWQRDTVEHLCPGLLSELAATKAQEALPMAAEVSG